MRRLISATILLVLVGCAPEPYEVVIEGGAVYDGSGGDPVEASIGIRNGVIAAVGVSANAPARTRIDAEGLAVVPGFIDPHTHALDDLLHPVRSANLNYLAQGVTTVFVGSDGRGVPDRASSLARLREQGTGPNVGFFAGHGDLRERVLGLENRLATEEELQAMVDLLEDEMRAGALGLSSGLFYTPGSFAPTSEVTALARVVGQFGGVYDTHMRSESSVAPGLLAAVREAIEIGEEADIPVHLSHLKALGSDTWGASGDIVALVEAARARGVDVTANQYPYVASGTRFSSALVPQWARADSKEAMLARFDNPDLAARLRADMAHNLRIRGGAEAMLVTGESDWRGLTLAQIAAAREQDPLDAALGVIREGDPSIASFVMQQDDIHVLAIQPWMMTGSDGSEGHPRKYGTYPQAYRDFVVAAGLMTTARFVARSSGQVADTFGLCDRGYLRPGRRADIAIIDLDAFDARADFTAPEELASGVRHVFVNGAHAIRDGEYTGALAGEVIHRQRLDCAD